ncbi:hypothetical protein AEST_32130 [Alishewanella aestuarii B11]|uniref:Uncharacterized protein n=1 Tax=Alishewanella aestuarii B11 TaxID=1197174 RepID=J2IAA0_9ALTE|nr:hypothetical protein AEST_32130 [Alishewanella aestuarii B11]
MAANGAQPVSLAVGLCRLFGYNAGHFSSRAKAHFSAV